MVEELIIEDDKFRLFLIPVTPHEDWINFRVKSVRADGRRMKRSRLAYCRSQKRLSENHSTINFRNKNPEDLNHVVSLLEDAIRVGLV